MGAESQRKEFTLNHYMYLKIDFFLSIIFGDLASPQKNDSIIC